MRHYFGVDLHKDFVMVVAVDTKQTVVQTALRISLSDLEAWAAQVLTREDEVALEATANAWRIYDLLSRYAGRVVVSNPNKTALIAKAHVKSDKVDAVILARLLAAQFLYTV